MTEKSDYQPVPCEMHSMLELVAMHGEAVELVVIGDDNQAPEPVTAVIKDILVKDGAEYALLLVDTVESLVRLDRIEKITTANKK